MIILSEANLSKIIFISLYLKLKFFYLRKSIHAEFQFIIVGTEVCLGVLRAPFKNKIQLEKANT